MKKRIKFVLACEVVDNMRLMQPHGMIPYTLHKYYGYDSEILSYRNGEYPYLENELKGLNIRFLPHYFSKKFKLPFFVYLALNAKKIDVLMVYNIKKRPIYNGLIYKLFNPNGFLYAKADTSWPRIGFYVDNAFFIYKYYMRALGKIFLNKCNAVSVESSLPYNSITQVHKDKLLFMPCGFDPDIVDQLNIKERTFDEKENIVLHISRIGSKQKNTEHILNSLVKMDIPDDWRFVFIGSQTDKFKQFKSDFIRKHPHLEGRLEFHEHISNKATLYDYYSRSKIFCLPSRWESFGNVLVEAEYFGNALLGSDHLPSLQDLIDNGRAGVAFSLQDENDLAFKLEQLMHDQERLRTMSSAAREYAMNNLIWNNIVTPLDSAIQKHYSL